MQFTYPAVFYYDEEYNDYAVEFSDICVYAEGDTMEEAYQNAQNYLTAYLETCEELKVAPNSPNTYESTLKDHPNGKIMLVTVDYESKHKKQKSQNEQKNNEDIFASLEDDIIEDIEQGLDDGDNPALKRFLESRILEQEEKQNDVDDGDDDFGLPEIE